MNEAHLLAGIIAVMKRGVLRLINVIAMRLERPKGCDMASHDSLASTSHTGR